MGHDPVDRVLEYNMSLKLPADTLRQENIRPYDPILNPTPHATTPPITPYDPNHIFDGKHFGQPATGDGE